MKPLLTLLLALWLPASLSAQKIASPQAKEDLIFLQKSIRTYNPALYTYNPDFDQQSDALIASLPGDSITHLQHFTFISKLCSMSNEGHFAMGSWSDTVHTGIPDNRYRYMPLEVKILEGKLYVWGDYSNEQTLSTGDEIISINGTSSNKILQSLQAATPADGHILTYANRIIEIGFSWLYYFHIEQAEQFTITLKSPKEAERRATITALTKASQTENYKQYVASTAEQPKPAIDGFYDIRYETDYAYLKLPSFDYRRVNQYKMKSKKMYKALFKALKKLEVTNLIIDLRDNTGGRNEFADDLVPFIMTSPTTDPYLKKTISWEGKEKVYSLPRSSKFAFRGHIYVLINGRTYSAGSSLARYLKEYANATLIGEESGTRYEGFAAGSKEEVTLPNLPLTIGIPRYHILYPESQKQTTRNRGVLPDYEISYSFEDIAQHKDLELEKALSLIKNLY